MVLFKTIAATLAVASVAQSAPAFGFREHEKRVDNGAPYLNEAAQAKGKKWFGTEIDCPSSECNNQNYMTVFNNSKIWGEVTPGNRMKWQFIEPNQNQFDFSGGQIVVDLAKQTGKKVRCHNLVWHQELPSWVSNGKWTNATLLAAMENHITKTVQHYGSSCATWDVVNEAIDDNGNYRSDVFYNTIGPAYLPLAFKYARAAAKSVGANIELVYNDYGIENPGAKQQKAVELVKLVQSYGANIDAVGFESHFVSGQTPSTAQQKAAMKSFSDLGLKIQQTEIDVRFTLPSSSAKLAQQAQDYYNTIAACMTTTACEAMTVWDFDDGYSWVPGTFPGTGDADLYNSDLTRKPAYTAVYEAIQGTKCTVCPA